MNVSAHYVWHALNHARTRLESVARRRGMSKEEAQDVVSDVIVRIAQRTDLNLTTIVGLAVVAVSDGSIDELRRRRRERLSIERMAVPAQCDSPELSACSSAAARSLLKHSANLLTRAEFRVLCLAVDGESHSAIAELLGITVRASEVALSRARGKLRQTTSGRIGETTPASRSCQVALG